MLINENIVDDENILKLILNYVTLRLDIINISAGEENTVELIENSDLNSRVSFPKWFKKEGKSQGMVVSSSNLSLDLKIKCLTDGDLRIDLRAPDIKDRNGERFPIYIDMNEFKINEEIILNKHNLVSYYPPKRVTKKVEKDEIVNIHVEWMPFNGDCEYKDPVKPLKKRISKLKDDLEFINSNNNSSVNLLEFKKYSDELSNLKTEFKEYKKTTDKYLDSVHFLLDDLYINHEQKPVGFLSRLHEVNVELLVFINKVCKKHNLEWWLDYGNLIGAVRHGGSVPWDDDIDIGMMRTDYMKLCEVLPEEIKEHDLDNIVDLYFRERIIDYRRAKSFLQIKFYSDTNLSDRRRLMANIDVFPYDYINSYDQRTIDDLHYNTKIEFFENQIHHKDPNECLKIMYDKLNLNFNKTNFIIPGVEGACGLNNTYKLSVFNTKRIFPLSEIEYSNVMLPCPNDVDYYLRKIYGDYLSLPKNLRKHQRAYKYRFVKDNHIYYLNLLETIREVNNNF